MKPKWPGRARSQSLEQSEQANVRFGSHDALRLGADVHNVHALPPLPDRRGRGRSGWGSVLLGRLASVKLEVIRVFVALLV